MGTRGNGDNHANQMNPNNDAYWQSRGWDERPNDWDERSDRKEEVLTPRPRQNSNSTERLGA